MRLDSLIVGKDKSVVAAIDPIADFANVTGIFSQCYGLTDSEPIRTACNMVAAETRRLSGHAHQTLFRSKYEYDQFGVPGLERLCTTEEGRKSVIPQELFDRVFDKTANSILSGGPEVEALIDERNFIIFEGVTTTSCIGMSIADIRRRFARKEIVIPRNVVASRLSRQNDESRMLDEFSRDDSKDVHVIERMSDIEFR